MWNSIPRTLKCKRCKIELPWAYICFYKNKANKAGVFYQCKECRKEWRENNKEKIKEYQKKWTDNNPEKVKEWRENNKEYMKEYKKEYMKENKEKIKEYNKEYKNSLASYKIYTHQISFCEKVRRDPNNKRLLQVKCKHSECRKWFNPTNREVMNRISAINGMLSLGTQNHFYCSEECKQSCSIFYQHLYPKGEKPYYSRPEQADWAAKVAENAGYECEICGSTENCSAHHFEGLNINPLMSADIDMGIYLCDACHKRAHSEIGCRPVDLTKRVLCP